MTAPQSRSAPVDEHDAQARAQDLAELLSYVTHQGDEEKRRLARQLHDKLGSSLTALSMHLSLLAKQMPDEQPLQERAALVKQLLVNIIDGNRALQASLWNDTFEFLGIKAALHEVVSAFGEQHQLAARLSLPEHDFECPREQALALLRCAEEGLSNIVAHAGASEVDVILDDNEDAWMLTVRDNGSGPANGQPEGVAHGLRLLRERARTLQGTLTLQADAGKGTSLTLLLPKQ